MGGRNHDPRISSQAARHVSYSRRGQGADEQDINPHRENARRDGVFEHIAGQARILADDDFMLAKPPGAFLQCFEDVRGSPSEFQGRFRRYWLDVRCSPDSVGPKDSFMLSHTALFACEADGLHHDVRRPDLLNRHLARSRYFDPK